VPKAEIYVFHTDIRAFGKGAEELYRKVRESGHVTFVHGKVSEVTGMGDGTLIVKAFDDMLGSRVVVPVDLLVLSTGLGPSSGAEELARTLNVVRGPDGFFLEAHPKLRPLDTATDGVFLAGVAQGPKDITDAVSQASGAASRASVPMAKGKVELESIYAVVDEDRCSGCRVCEGICAYSAIKVEEVEGKKLRSKVTEAQCKGCGACAAACPSGAISMKHFKDEQLLAMIRALCS
jgi:heterodisulfide reductase subunit A